MRASEYVCEQVSVCVSELVCVPWMCVHAYIHIRVPVWACIHMYVCMRVSVYLTAYHSTSVYLPAEAGVSDWFQMEEWSLFHTE